MRQDRVPVRTEKGGAPSEKSPATTGVQEKSATHKSAKRVRRMILREDCRLSVIKAGNTNRTIKAPIGEKTARVGFPGKSEPRKRPPTKGGGKSRAGEKQNPSQNSTEAKQCVGGRFTPDRNPLEGEKKRAKHDLKGESGRTGGGKVPGRRSRMLAVFWVRCFIPSVKGKVLQRMRGEWLRGSGRREKVQGDHRNAGLGAAGSEKEKLECLSGSRLGMGLKV